MGITGARRCALPLSSAHLCARFICGNIEMPWWRECGCIPGGQGVAGSNPAVPTGSYAFSNIVTPHKSQHKSQLVVQRPLCNGPLEARADRMPRPPYGACATTAEPIEAPQSRSQRSPSRPNLHGPANCQPAGAIRARRRYSTCETRTDQGAQARPAHAAVDARRPAWKAAPRPGRHDCSDLHHPLDTGCILATAKVPSRSAANAMDGQMSSRALKLAARHMTSRNKCA